MKKTLSLLTIAGFFLVILSCGSDADKIKEYTDAENCTTTGASVKYAAGVAPIVTSACGSDGCHSTKTAAEGVVLDTYAGTKECFATGDCLCSIKHDGCKKMPQGGNKLDAATTSLLVCWVKNGTPQ